MLRLTAILQISALAMSLFIGLPAEASKVNFKLDSNNNPRLSDITKNPEEQKFEGQTVYRFQIEHGGCGGDENWSDCNNDRQRVELKDGYKVSLQTFSSKKILNGTTELIYLFLQKRYFLTLHR